MYRWFWKFGIIFFVYGQISLWAISRDILRGPRLFWHRNCTTNSIRAGGYYFNAGKTHNRRFREVFRGGQDFFDPQIFLSGFLRSVGFLCRRVSNSTNKYSIGLITSFLVTRYVFYWVQKFMFIAAHALYECMSNVYTCTLVQYLCQLIHTYPCSVVSRNSSYKFYTYMYLTVWLHFSLFKNNMR